MNCLWSARCHFFFPPGNNFKNTFLDFHFMIFTKVLMKELTRIFIHVHKISNRRVSLKILLIMCLIIVEKKLWHSCDQVTFGIALSSKQKKIKKWKHRIPWHLHAIQKSCPLKTWESHFSIVWVMELLVKAKIFLKTATCST